MTSVGSVLLTGANGFVGQQLADWLSGRGWKVRPTLRRPHPEFRFHAAARVVGNIGPDTDWRAALAGMDAVVHLAARVHVMQETVANPLAAFRAVNVAGTEHLARTAAAAGVRRFVYLSSVKVNGEATSALPFRETDVPAPQDAYGQSKWEAEQALSHVARQTGLEIVIIRPPLVYGPCVGANFRRLMSLAGKGLPLPLGTVHNRRSLVYVGNLCSAIEACLEHPAAAGKTFLVSDGQDVSTAELLRRLAALQQAPDRLWHLPPSLLRLLGTLAGKSAEVSRLTDSLQVDNGCICRELAWHPPFSLEQGLAVTVAAFCQDGASRP